MKLQYEIAGVMVIVGFIVAMPLLTYHYLDAKESTINQKLKDIEKTALKTAHHMENHFIGQINICRSISSTPLIQDVLKESNRAYSSLSEAERQKRIETFNKKWIGTNDLTDPFVVQHIHNTTAVYLKSLQEISPGKYGEIFLTNRYGTTIATTGKLTTLSHSHKYWWKAAFNHGKGKIVLDDRGFDSSVKGAVLGVVVPIKKDGVIAGIIKFNINIKNSLTDIIEDYSDRQLKVLIARTKGLIVASPELEPLSDNLPKNIIRFLQFGGKQSMVAEISSELYFVATSPIELTVNSDPVSFAGTYQSPDHTKGNQGEGWHIVVLIGKHSVLKALSSSFELVRRLLIASIIGIILVAIIISRWITRPIRSLIWVARQLGQGNLEVEIETYKHNEIGMLSDSLRKMAADLKSTLVSKDQLKIKVEEVKKAEESLLDANQQLLATLQAIPDLVFEVNDQGRIFFCHADSEQALNVAPEKLIGQLIEDLLPPNAAESVMSALKKAKTTGKHRGVVYKLDMPQGEQWFGLSIASKGNHTDPECRFVLLISDISDRKSTEIALQNSERRFRTMTELLPSGVVEMDPDLNIIYINDWGLKMFGYTQQDLKNGLNAFDILHSENWEKAAKRLAIYQDGGYVPPVEYRMLTKNDSTIPVLFSAVPLIQENCINGYMASITDLTGVKEVEKVLKEKEENLRNIFENATNIFYSHTPEHVLTHISPQVEDILGYTQEEAMIKWTELASDNPINEIGFQHTRTALKTGKRQQIFNFELVKKNGERIWAEVREFPFVENGKTIAIMGSLTDISKRKLAEEKLTISEKRFALAMEATKDGLWDWDIATGKVYYSPGYSTMLGYSSEDFPPHINTWIELIHEEDKDRVLVANSDCIENKCNDFQVEFRMQAGDGSWIWVLLRGMAASRDNNRRATRLIGTQTSISDRKEKENLIKAALSEKETLLAEIHHRVKNNIQVIGSILELHANSTQQEEVKKELRVCKGRVYAISAVHETLYGSNNLSRIDLKSYLTKLVGGLVQIFSINEPRMQLKLEGENAELHIEIASPLGLVVNELVSNILKYAYPDNQKGEIKIVTSIEDDQIELTVQDDGIGMPENFNWRNSNTLGLKLVRTLVENQLNGSISMESINGTKFKTRFVNDRC